MNIEFFSDSESTCNVRFPGEAYASNEVILGVFYECISAKEAASLLKDIDAVIKGDLPVSKQDDYDFGDFIGGVIRPDFCVLRPDGIESKSYRLDPANLKEAIRQWLSFIDRAKPNDVMEIFLDVEVMD